MSLATSTYRAAWSGERDARWRCAGFLVARERHWPACSRAGEALVRDYLPLAEGSVYIDAMSQTLVLSDEVDRDAIDDAIAASGLSLINVVAESATHPRQIMAATASARATFVSDMRLGVQYVALEGEHESELAARLGAALPLVSFQALERAIHSEVAQERGWAVAHAVGFRDAERALPLIEQALGDADRSVRKAALIAAAYLPSPGLGALLIAHASRETDSELESVARSVAAAVGAR